MPFLNKPVTWISLVLAILMHSSVQAAMVTTPDIVLDSERSRVIQMLDREEVREQLKEMGVDHAAAERRVNQMTAEELAELNGQIDALPAGAASTTELLLIIIIIIILI